MLVTMTMMVTVVMTGHCGSGSGNMSHPRDSAWKPIHMRRALSSCPGDNIWSRVLPCPRLLVLEDEMSSFGLKTKLTLGPATAIPRGFSTWHFLWGSRAMELGVQGGFQTLPATCSQQHSQFQGRLSSELSKVPAPSQTPDRKA